MSAETELYAVLTAASGLTALVSTRIYPDILPEETALPAVVYTRTGTQTITTIHGGNMGEFADLQINAWGKTRASAAAVADQIDAALQSAKFPKTNRISGIDDELLLFVESVSATWFVAT